MVSTSSPESKPPKPAVLAPRFETIPAELKAYHHWFMCRLTWVPHKGKHDKPPYQVDGRLGDATNPQTFAWYEHVEDIYLCGGWDGFGFAPCKKPEHADPFVIGDLDKCVNAATGEIDPKALAIIKRLATYTEYSISGTGLRWIAKGKVNGDRSRVAGFEMYQDERWLTITGHHLPGTPLTIEHRQDVIDQLYAEHFPEPEKVQRTTNSFAGARISPLTDEELIYKAASSRGGDQFLRLWSGSTHGYASHSEADLALIGKLAFWCGPDPDRIERLMTASGLGQRGKWSEREDYRLRTILKVLNARTEFYRGCHASN